MESTLWVRLSYGYPPGTQTTSESPDNQNSIHNNPLLDNPRREALEAMDAGLKSLLAEGNQPQGLEEKFNLMDEQLREASREYFGNERFANQLLENTKSARETLITGKESSDLRLTPEHSQQLRMTLQETRHWKKSDPSKVTVNDFAKQTIDGFVKTFKSEMSEMDVIYGEDGELIFQKETRTDIYQHVIRLTDVVHHTFDGEFIFAITREGEVISIALEHFVKAAFQGPLMVNSQRKINIEGINNPENLRLMCIIKVTGSTIRSSCLRPAYAIRNAL